jgi:CRISPR system Cascade subunit CasC
MLVFLNPREVEMVAARLWELYREKGAAGFAKLKIGEIEAAMKHETPRSVDIAMFGRMTTSTAFEDVQAAVQVAHAISTNTVAPQFDYFTAVDDISGESGAGMIGTVEFNSNTYYKYFCVHWEKLVENLGGDAEIALDAVTALIEAAALTHPSGKQNSFAAHNPPDFVLVEVSPRNIPLSYANAFVRPAAPTPQETLVEASARMLVEYADQVRPAYGLEAEQACLSLAGPAPRAARVTPTLQKLQEWVREQVGRGQDG